VQSSLFEEYAAKLSQDHAIDAATARLQARTFVSDPGTVYPHGTGGTVDLTLSINGQIAWMGTGFDDFFPQAHRRWFDDALPRTPQEMTAHRNRQILYESMQHAGFVGLADEWWHYEWGTTRWAEEKRRQPVLTDLAEFLEP
jgi:D-alanyl-D-alanine dipeptidase